MTDKQVRKLFQKHKALLSGHFLLSSGLHSDRYFQSALILQYPKVAGKLAKALAGKVLTQIDGIDVVVSPALGGIVIGQEMARALKCRSIFLERVEGKLTLRRGFEISPQESCLVVEDVITTGLSTREVMDVVKSLEGNIVSVASLVDRSAGKVDFGSPRFSLLSLEVKSWKPEECPLCKEGIAVVKPGSRNTK